MTSSNIVVILSDFFRVTVFPDGPLDIFEELVPFPTGQVEVLLPERGQEI